MGTAVEVEFEEVSVHPLMKNKTEPRKYLVQKSRQIDMY